jgi:hypothetical protein
LWRNKEEEQVRLQLLWGKKKGGKSTFVGFVGEDDSGKGGEDTTIHTHKTMMTRV